MPTGRLAVSMLGLALLTFTSCAATGPYTFGTGRAELDDGLYPEMDEQFLYGEPNEFLDASDWFWPGSLLGKLILWDKNVDAHEISPETVAEMKRYIERNDLRDVQVLVNRYDPGLQWDRLTENEAVAPGWRYTFGALSVLVYTILPGRFFGGDHYNPYTNTVSLYSDDGSIALHEAGHAKDFSSREDKGTHAFLYMLPFAPLYYESNATRDALSYLALEGDAERLADGYDILYPAYGTYVAGIAGAVGGHVVGAGKAGDAPEEVDTLGASSDDEPAQDDPSRGVL